MKNLVLSGVNKLVLMHGLEDGNHDYKDFCPLFFSQLEHFDDRDNLFQTVQTQLRRLNPSCDITLASSELPEQQSFDMLVYCGHDRQQTIQWNSYARDNSIPFSSSAIRGAYGYLFSDFGESFSYKATKESDLETMKFITFSSVAASIDQLMEKGDHRASKKESLLCWQAFSQDPQHSQYVLGTTSAVAGHASQDIIRGIVRVGKPSTGVILFNGIKNAGYQLP